MKKTGIAFVVLAIILVSCDGAQAQKPALKSTPVTIAPDLTKLNIEKILQQVQRTSVQPSTQETSPLQVVAEFLQNTSSTFFWTRFTAGVRRGQVRG